MWLKFVLEGGYILVKLGYVKFKVVVFSDMDMVEVLSMVD